MFAKRTEWKRERNRYAIALSTARESGARLLDLMVSNPTECGLHFDSAAILGALAHPESLRYDPQPQGLLSARQAVADYYNRAKVRHAGFTISPEQIFLTTSTSEAYSFLFRLLCNPDDEVLVPRPSYPLFEFLAEIQDVRLRYYDLFYDHGWHVDTDGLVGQINETARAVLVVNPNNPTGSFIHRKELERLTAVCKERELALIGDEVFLDYEVEASAEDSIAFSSECLSFALSGLSKISCLPQMKLAWIVLNGPARLQEEARHRLEVIADTYLSVNAPIQHALPDLLAQRSEIQPQLISGVKENLAFLDKQLSAVPSIERLRIEAGWYAVLRVPATKSDEESAIELIETAGVVVHPGHFYDFSQDGFLVISLITPSNHFREGVAALLTVLRA
jgi:alanine-synthesizing transaminase